MSGDVTPPRAVDRLLRAEWLAIAVAVLVAYAWSGASWTLFFLLILAPDLSMAGYLGGPRQAQFHGVALTSMAPEDMEQILADTVLKDFKTRLGRIGVEYQTPLRP